MSDQPERPKTQLICPCGEHLTGQDEDKLVQQVREHLAAQHPGHDYTREQILFMAF